jgi:hypothetical protein
LTVKTGMTRKADAIAREVGCIVIAPDTYRGESTRFIPKAIYLALETPQVYPSCFRLGLAVSISVPKESSNRAGRIAAITFYPF